MQQIKKGLATVACLLSYCFAFAQDAPPASVDTTYWQNSLSIGVNFSQAQFSDNWKAGGVNSIAIGSVITGTANYQKGKVSWANEADLQYGIVRNAEIGERKSVDRILLDSKLGFDISQYWNGFFSLNFLTQFTPGYRYEENAQGGENAITISRFMAPAFLTTALGFEYKPSKVFWVRLSPFSPRFTFVTDDLLFLNEPSNYGVEPGETVRTEWLAAQVQASLDKEIVENVTLKSRYQLFANYENMAFNRIDHRLDVNVVAKVNKWLNINFSTILLYDYDQDEDIQLSQLLTVGLLYTVDNKE